MSTASMPTKKHTNYRERDSGVVKPMQSKAEPAKTVTTYSRRKRRGGGGVSNSEAAVSNVLGREVETVKHCPCVSQVADASVAYPKMKTISCAEDVTLLPHQNCSERRSKRMDICKNTITVEETGFCEAKLIQECPNLPRRRSQRKRKSKKVAEEFSDLENSSPQRPSASDCHGLPKRGKCNNAITQQEGKLKCTTFECYLENMWRSFSEEKKNSFTHLDSMWYSLYSTESWKERVLKWIKKKDIFSKKYVFIPIVQWSHWALLIFCHFGESLESKSKTKTPCMLLLDSLQTMGPKRLEPGIRKFVLDIYRTQERGENEKKLYKMPFLVPKVPQQINGEECGFYVLYYIKLFVESAPENFSTCDGYPYFMKQDWFTPEGFSCFCQTLDSSSDQNLF